MHRLVIVSGPNRGSSYSLVEGENTIGRQMDNHIVLSSSKISKRHCSLLVTSKEVLLRDEGSTNGTFVNGTLVRKIPLKSGDKIGLGEFVLELSAPLMKRAASQQELQVVDSSLPAGGALSQMPSVDALTPADAQGGITAPPAVEMPQDLPGKIEFLFEHRVMPFFYGNLMKSEYRSIVAVLFAILVIVSVIGAALPALDLAEQSIQREAMIRAKVIAREVADRFTPAIASRAESQIDLSFLESEDSVKMVVIVDPNLQIIAPQSKLNQMLGGGREATFAVTMAKEFKEGRDKGFGKLLSESVATFIEPIRITEPRLMKNQFAAMVLVSIDFSSNLLNSGGLGVAYGTGLVIAGACAILIFFILMRMTLKPFEVLNDDLDQILRGELPKVTHEFKIAELDALWSNINSTVQKGSSGGGGGSGGADGTVNWDYEFAAMKSVCETANLGFVALDPQLNVVSMNSQFEEVSGIRMDAVGQSISQVARDQSLISLSKDLLDRVQSSSNRSALDDFEFSGVAYQVIGTAMGPASQTGLGLVFKRKE